MIIAICGSLTFHKEMRTVQRELEALGYTAIVPKSIDLMDYTLELAAMHPVILHGDVSRI